MASWTVGARRRLAVTEPVESWAATMSLIIVSLAR